MTLSDIQKSNYELYRRRNVPALQAYIAAKHCSTSHGPLVVAEDMLNRSFGIFRERHSIKSTSPVSYTTALFKKVDATTIATYVCRDISNPLYTQHALGRVDDKGQFVVQVHNKYFQEAFGWHIQDFKAWRRINRDFAQEAFRLQKLGEA